MSQETQTVNNDEKIKAFGARLKMERERKNLDYKSAAANIRLNERIVIMLENGQYDADLPLTFLKGYVRLYATSLMIPDSETKQIIELLKPVTATLDPALLPPTEHDVTSKNLHMQLASAVVGLTIIGLVGTWWHAHSTTQALSPAHMTPIAIPAPQVAPAPPSPAAAPVTAPGSAVSAPQLLTPPTPTPAPAKPTGIVIPPNNTTATLNKAPVVTHPAAPTATKSVPVEDLSDDSDDSDNNTDNNSNNDDSSD